MVPWPLGGSEGGNRWSWTTPEARPSARRGASGWIACARRSEFSGYVHTVSNIDVGGLWGGMWDLGY